MKLEVRRDSFEGSSSIKDNRAQPRGMRPRTHDSDVAFVPIALEIGPSLTPAVPDGQLSSSDRIFFGTFFEFVSQNANASSTTGEG